MMGKIKKIAGTASSAAEKNFSRKLRSSAEKIANTLAPIAPACRSLEDTLHELQVNQIELEMQNEELKRTQAILEESRERYVDFYDFAPLGYFTLASDGSIININLTGASMLGEERNSLLHRYFGHFIVPADRERWEKHLKSVLQYEKSNRCELSIMCKDGTNIHVQLDSLRQLKRNEATVVRLAMTDITERVQAEEKIREQEEFFRMITENIEDFIAVLDLDGRRLYNSPSYMRLFNNIEKIKGTDSFSEVHPDDREWVKNVFNETVQNGVGMKIEYRFVQADGSIHYMESHGTLIRNSKGQPLRVVVISHDITERKKADERIHKLAYFDTLTQLPNRRLLDDRLNHAMASSKRNGHYCALMFMDLDNFKPLNDLYGHGVGDALLIEVAQRIGSCVREMDTVARFGGDEFVVMLSELDTDKESSIEQTRIVAEKIRSIIGKPYFLTVKNKDNTEIKCEHHCTASIGVMMFTNHEYRPEEIIKQADIQMYHAKERGRNRICFFCKTIQANQKENESPVL